MSTPRMGCSARDVPEFQKYVPPDWWECTPYTRSREQEGYFNGGEFTISECYVSDMLDYDLIMPDTNVFDHHLILSEHWVGRYWDAFLTPEGGLQGVTNQDCGYYHLAHLFECSPHIIEQLRHAARTGTRATIRGKAVYMEGEGTNDDLRFFRGFDGRTTCPVICITSVELKLSMYQHFRKFLKGLGY
jgi:hypothetical protein